MSIIKEIIACLMLLCNPFNYFAPVSMEWDKKLNSILNDFEYDGYVDFGDYHENNGEYLQQGKYRYQIKTRLFDVSVDILDDDKIIFGYPFCALGEIYEHGINQRKNYNNKDQSSMRPRLRTQLRYILTVYKERRAYHNRDLFKGEFDD